MSEIMKIIDERETQNKTKNKDRRKQGGKEALLKGWELNDFVVHLSLRFSTIKMKCLTFKSNLELALSIILKQTELYEPKHVAGECRCLKIWDLLSFLICS